MLTEKRYEMILELLDKKRSVTVPEIKEVLRVSESTIRRDLTALDKAGRLTKVFGGAVSAEGTFTGTEPSVAQKLEVQQEEKRRIAQFAAGLIQADDFIYLDAGTTTGYILDYLPVHSATFVTNAVSHARKLAAAGNRVILIGGELKGTTEAGVGSPANCYVLADSQKFGTVSSVTFAPFDGAMILTETEVPEGFAGSKNVRIV